MSNQKNILITKYNILLLIDKLENNDVSLYVVKLANYLFQNNVGVIILTSECKIKNLIDHNIILITRKSISNSILFNQKNIKFIQNVCETYSIDLINSFTLFTSYLAYNVIKKIKNIHYITTILDIHFFMNYKHR